MIIHHQCHANIVIGASLLISANCPTAFMPGLLTIANSCEAVLREGLVLRSQTPNVPTFNLRLPS